MTQAALACLQPLEPHPPWTESDKVDDNRRTTLLSLSSKDGRHLRLHPLPLVHVLLFPKEETRRFRGVADCYEKQKFLWTTVDYSEHL